MTSVQLGVLTLLRSAITGEKYPLPEGFDMEQALPILKRHSLIAMGYLGAVNCGISKSEPIMVSMFPYYCRSAVTSQRQLDKIQAIFDAFEENCIDYMPLKGTLLKRLYPSHELRPMGDADILIRTEQYDRIKPVMESLGLTEQREIDYELPWSCPELYVELHKGLVSASDEDLHAYYKDPWRLAKLESGSRWQMSADNQFVFLVTHFAKHFRGGGIGCRHVLDLWVYLQKNPQLDQAYICRELNKLFLLEFYQNLQRLIDAWFADGDWDDITEFISDFIFDSGVWGGQRARDLASNAKYLRGSGKAGKGKFVYFLHRAFPDLEYASFQYPILKKAPVLLPGVWIVRLFHILLRKPKLAKRRVQMLDSANDTELLAWDRNMSYVGLKYWHDE